MNIKYIIKYIDKLKPFFIQLHLFVLGLTWISVHIYIRFFLERPAYTLNDIKPFLTTKHYIFFTWFILIHIGIVISIGVTLYRQKYPRTKPSIFIRLAEKINYIINIIYWKPLEYIHDLIAPHIPMSGRFFLYVESVWSEKPNEYFYRLIFILEILPRLIIALTFLIEVVIYGKVQLFIYSLGLILIPISWHIFLKLFDSFGERSLPGFLEYFEAIIGIGTPIVDEHGKIIGYTRYEFFVKDEYEDNIDAKEYANLILQFESMRRFVIQLKKDTEKVMPYVTMLSSVIFIIGGAYRLVFFIL